MNPPKPGALAAALSLAMSTTGALWPLAARADATPAAPETDPAEPALPDLSVTANGPRPPLTRSTSMGFAGMPDWQQPVQGFSVNRLRPNGVQRLSDLERLEASVGNGAALNGYLESMSIRGQVLDSTHNYRRDGLPIQAGTRLALDAMDRVEVMQGVSGIQAGLSSPAGLINLVVKRPAGTIRRADVALDQHGGLLTAVDLGDESGVRSNTEQPAVSWRLNVAGERLHPAFDNGQGQRHVLALATDVPLGHHMLLEAEFEQQRHVQAGLAAVSMTGNTLPTLSRMPADFNINSQPWSQPLRTQGTVGSLRLTQTWADGWRGSLHLASQQLRTDNHATGGVANAQCVLLRQPPCDRYASDGGYAVVGYDSLDERRRQETADAQVNGHAQTGAAEHTLTAGLMRSQAVRNLPSAVYQVVGFSNLYAPTNVPAPNGVPNLLQEIAHETTNEFYGRDHIRWSPSWHSWLGLRHTQLGRTQTLSDGSATSRLNDRYTTAWGALGWAWGERSMARIGWGEGLEVPPARLSTPLQRVSNSGEPLPAAKSRQWEAGVQGETAWGQWGLNAFWMRRPESNALPDPASPGAVRASEDGSSRYHGLEARWQRSWANYNLDASWMWLDARREGSADATLNGQQPVNVPGHALRVSQAYRWPGLQGLVGQLDLIEDGPRLADPVTGTKLPAWWRCDASLQLTQGRGSHTVKWGLRVTNLLDRRAWAQAPQQPGHVYLVPMAPRLVMATAAIQY